ncbi:putative peptidyl-prolyl cis-trans isomerase [Novipirellula aureliae]|uniref:peptidylprolyl isomerase n=1 Tax=Novipirellula aureliae TaxID=2527966 RepID=A0A5C6E8F2_9BACT|nr:peptidylprolyl isomerase [Novipirellula aureliae]TWU45953.1 putative peptidyl-prolyl cis-trans isomerase [Novipirellula aureliae]
MNRRLFIWSTVFPLLCSGALGLFDSHSAVAMPQVTEQPLKIVSPAENEQPLKIVSPAENDPSDNAEQDDDLQGGDLEQPIEIESPAIEESGQPAAPAISSVPTTEEGKAAKAAFENAEVRLRSSVLKMREIHIRYMNGEDRTPQALEQYRQERINARQLMEEVFEAAYNLLFYVPDSDAAQFVLTMVQHEYDKTNYSERTMRAGSLLLDLNFNQAFLFQAVARSSVCCGDFEIARKIYEYMNPEALEDLDKRFLYQMDILESQWKEELEQRKIDEQSELPRVHIKTTKGDIVVELFLNEAPSAVANFIKLVEEGYYDGLDFHQVLDDLLALTGDETGQGSGNTGQFLVDEHTRENARNAFRGSLAMAKMPMGDGEFVENSASSQFAIFFTPLPFVSENQTVFGRVIEGMDLLTEIRRVDPSKEKKKGEIIMPPDRIIETEVIRKPDSMPEPVYVETDNGKY